MPTKNIFKKAAAYVCMAGVITITNAPLVNAYEAHVMNVTANIIDDSVAISPTGDKFCDDGKQKIELKTNLAGASIYYTTDGTVPKCQTNGTLYSAPFALSGNKTVKAVSCHDGIQSLVISKAYDISDDYCSHSVKINKVYYNPDQAHMAGTCNNENEWVELFNPSREAVNIKNWKICDAQSCDILSSGDLEIPAKGYAVVAWKTSTWNYWNVPADVIKINLQNAIGDGLYNSADLIKIKDASGAILDQMNWGTPSATWPNYNSGLWNPGLAVAAEGKVMGRISNGYDTDSISDWTVYSLPEVTVNYPNGGETWLVGNSYTIKWAAKSSASSALSIDLYYSADSGKSWANIVKNTENDGSYSWRVPLAITGSDGTVYKMPSKTARIKVVATDYNRNFMLSNWDISDKDFCPPIDMSLLTAEEIELLKTMDTSGMTIINSAQTDSLNLSESSNTTVSAISATSTTDGKTNVSTENKAGDMINEEKTALPENKSQTGDDKDSGGAGTGSNGPAIKPEGTAVDSITQTSPQADKDADKNGAGPITAGTIAATETSISSTTSEKTTVGSSNIAVENSNKTEVSVQTAVQETTAISPDKNATIEFNLNA